MKKERSATNTYARIHPHRLTSHHRNRSDYITSEFLWQRVLCTRNQRVTTFAIINEVEITELARLKAPGCAILTYTALLTFCRNKVSCFPSIETIRNYLGNHYNLRTIHKALKWLSDNKLIKRNEKTSKRRFVLLKRLISHTPDRAHEHAQSGTIRKEHKKTSFLREELKKYKEIVRSFPRKRRKSKPSKKELARREAQRAKQQAKLERKEQSAERAWALIVGHDYSINDLTEIQRINLLKAIQNKTLQDYDWIQEYHPRKILSIQNDLGGLSEQRF